MSRGLSPMEEEGLCECWAACWLEAQRNVQEEVQQQVQQKVQQKVQEEDQQQPRGREETAGSASVSAVDLLLRGMEANQDPVYGGGYRKMRAKLADREQDAVSEGVARGAAATGPVLRLDDLLSATASVAHSN
jgi:hypothetical protein